MSPLVLQKLQNKFITSKQKLVNLYQNFGLGVIQKSPYDNIYYCCTQKTASQWFRSVLNDFTFYQYTGLIVHPYVELGLRYAAFEEALPKRTIGTHLYISYPTYLTIPKPAHYKTFFILRDPRDIIVSWYFSAKYSHGKFKPVMKMRHDLENLDFTEGLKYIIDRLEEFGSFEAQKSWVQGSLEQDNVKIFRYEDLAEDNSSFLQQLFNYLEIQMPAEEFTDLCQRHQFESKTEGRNQGKENVQSHYRKGIAGDWKNYFDYATTSYFKAVTKDLLEQLGYPE
ncbi:sulfotransferase domain-containing protein [Halothece sp. PCC 7418]|uniref:sulfotransferase domain-containing protein n=1 Tax=Halothece sp. (strain PCC 7418) TaxID=65093 RepID=UPI0002F72DB5|nr:sulfotransferase domain-containing protein [Halothece sp. PCC 7418]